MAKQNKQDDSIQLIAQNKRARHDYAIEDTYEAGLVLTGTEVKSLREGRASLAESFIAIDKRGEIWLEGANIPEYLNGTWNNHAPKRKRKLLLHAHQIEKLARQTQAKGYTIAAEPVFQGRARQGADRARPRQEGIRQASGIARGTGQARSPARHALQEHACARLSQLSDYAKTPSNSAGFCIRCCRAPTWR